MTVGIVKKDKMVKAKAEGEGNPVFYVGARTGRDGIHGASFASRDLSEESESKRSAVQVGDPFMEKLLMEASLELAQTDSFIGMQDMGAAGLSCATSEMSAKGAAGKWTESGSSWMDCRSMSSGRVKSRGFLEPWGLGPEPWEPDSSSGPPGNTVILRAWGEPGLVAIWFQPTPAAFIMRPHMVAMMAACSLGFGAFVIVVIYRVHRIGILFA
jgi:hypothetical protein